LKSRRLSTVALLLLTIALLLSSTGSRLAAQIAAEKVIGGPYVVNVGQRSATVMWVVQTGQVAIGADATKLDQIVPVLRAQQTVLNGLKAGATYHYEAFPGEAGKGSFKTAAAGEGPFQFVVYGDTRTRHDVHRSVIAGILKHANPDFVVHTGDLVENGSDSSLWPIFFDAERELLRKAAIFPALGNHERHANSYFEFMDAKPYYSFNWGNAHFAVIDSDLGSVEGSPADREAYWQKQTRWLEDDLEKAQKSDFRFVFAHHPPMTAVKSRQGSSPHMTALEPMLEKYRVAAGFFGHDHNYQHYLKNGIQYFITGGGGAPLYDVDVPPPGITKLVERTENFVIVNVNGKKARVEAKRPNGSTLDVTELGQ
jgi:predicted phosphodiesterase